MPRRDNQKSKRAALDRLRDLARRLFRKRNPEPLDPFADQLAPLRRGPGPRSGAAAVAEPEED